MTAPVEAGLASPINGTWAGCDTLQYMGRDPIHRPHHHSEISWSPPGWFVLLSRRGGARQALLAKMAGEPAQLAQLRAYYGFMWAHPGNKLLFMGGEFGQGHEWSHDAALDWAQAASSEGQGLSRLVRDLNGVLRAEPALHRDERDERGFDWSVADDNRNSVYAFIRRDPAGGTLLVVSNFTGAARAATGSACRTRGVGPNDSTPTACTTVAAIAATSGGAYRARPMHGHAQSLRLTLPPLSTLYLRLMHDGSDAAPGRMACGR